MSLEKEEVERSIRELGLSEQLRAIPDEEARRLYGNVEDRFADKKGARWLWEHLRVPSSSRQFNTPDFQHLPRILPTTGELLFFPGSDEEACAFRGTAEAITAVLSDCFRFEYCLTPPGLEWLVCENHHGLLIAVGDPVQARLRELEA